MRGLIKPAQIAQWCKDNGLQAAAITDYGNMLAVPSLYKACNRLSIKPIFGMEVYIVPDKTEKGGDTQRLVLLALNKVGFKNLVSLSTVGWMYFYYIPRLDYGDLLKYGQGIAVLTGDIVGGMAAQRFFEKGSDGLASVWRELTSAFEHVYFELEPVPTEAQRVYNDALVEFWKKEEGRVKLILTGDPHYMSVEDEELYKNFLAIKNWRNPGWEYPYKGPYHVRNRDEMCEQMGDLHGYDVSFVPGYKQAFEAQDEIIDMVEKFDLRSGVKIPSPY